MIITENDRNRNSNLCKVLSETSMEDILHIDYGCREAQPSKLIFSLQPNANEGQQHTTAQKAANIHTGAPGRPHKGA